MPAPGYLPVVAHASHHASSSRQSTCSTTRIENHRRRIVDAALSARLAVYGAHLPVSERHSQSARRHLARRANTATVSCVPPSPRVGCRTPNFCGWQPSCPNILHASYIKTSFLAVLPAKAGSLVIRYQAQCCSSHYPGLGAECHVPTHASCGGCYATDATGTYKLSRGSDT
jgi:hypothetical protein